jgi:predicted nuclease of predicted toxin-antitoxin system
MGALGMDAVHVKDYPGGDRFPDTRIAAIADTEDRFVVTKDDDFRVSHLLHHKPKLLLHVTCGNISTADLLALVDEHRDALLAGLALHTYLQLDRPGVIVHDLP